MANIGEPFGINVGTCQKQVDAAPEIHRSLNFYVAVDFRSVEVVWCLMPWLRPIPGVVRKQGNYADSGV